MKKIQGLGVRALAGAGLLGCAAAFASMGALGADAVSQAERDGAALYGQYCESCHGGGVAKAPQLSLLEIMAPSSILRAMQGGVMQTQAADMSDAEQRRVAEYLAGQSLAADHMQAAAPMCCAERAEFDYSARPDTRGWGVNAGNARMFDEATAGMTADDLGELELKWAFAFPGAVRARSQ
ncbi:MAG TPA: cytochrome c, partial [Kineobactrum sp.]